MNLKKGLVGFFILCFLLSGVSLGLLVLDDQNDLSSRASTGLVSSLQKALPTEVALVPDAAWQGTLNNQTIQFIYNHSLWSPPTDGDIVFVNQQKPISARLIKGVVTLPILRGILGPDFDKPQTDSQFFVFVPGWSTMTYTFLFYGESRTVDVWINPLGFSVVSVMPDVTGRGDVMNLVKGFSADKNVLGISTSDDSARLAATIRPSVVMLINKYCASVKFSAVGDNPLAGKQYPFCLAEAGSGFFVNKDGYIATNGHVVTNFPEQSVILGASSGGLDNLLTDYLQAYLSTLTPMPVDRAQVAQKVTDSHKTPETNLQMAALVDQFYKKSLISLESQTNNFYVQLGSTPIQITKTTVNLGTDIVEAKFVAADYLPPDPLLGFSASDVALIKVSGSNYPALPLGKLDDVSVGSDVLVVGFPGVANGSQSQLLDRSANAEPTFTKGVVSAFKQAKGDKKNLIQTDASINHGNSGGPAVSSAGNVVGIATYGLVPDEGSGNYNFLRDVADLKALMVKNNIAEDVGQTHNLWKSGLDNYWIGYFKPAKADFEQVLSLYPNHPTVNKYLQDATAKIGTPDDKTPKFTHSQRKLLMNVSGGMMAISVVSIIILLVSEYIDSKRQKAPVFLPPQTF